MKLRSAGRVAPLGLVVLILSLISPVSADTQARGYEISIKAFLKPQSDSAFTEHGDPTRPVARIHQSSASPGQQIAATVSICASGYVNLGRFRLKGVRSNSDFRIRYSRSSDGVDITNDVVAGTYRTHRFDLGKCFRYRVDVIELQAANVGDLRTVSLAANPEGPGWATVKAATHVRVVPACDVIVNGQPAC